MGHRRGLAGSQPGSGEFDSDSHHVSSSYTMPPKYVLFKNPIQNDTRAIVRYLDAVGKSCPPTYIVERNHPSWVTALPAILDLVTDTKYIGFAQSISYWEQSSSETDLVNKSISF